MYRKHPDVSRAAVSRPKNKADKRGSKKKCRYLLNYLRLRDLACLATWRRRLGNEVDDHAILRAAAFELPFLSGAPMRRKTHQVHPGLDALSLKDFARRIRSRVSDDEIREIVGNVWDEIKARGKYGLSSDEVGQLVSMTIDERAGLHLHTLAAVEEPAALRKIRVAEEKRARDRQRSQAKRRAAGIPPKTEQATSKLVQDQPWKAEGIGRSTWFDRRKRAGWTPASRTSEGETFERRENPTSTEVRSTTDDLHCISSVHIEKNPDLSGALAARPRRRAA